MTENSSPIAAIRQFNRFYTKQIGVLHEGLLQSPFSLTEARVIYELGQHESVTASELCGELGLNPGYLSRILRGFAKKKLIERQPSPSDKRQTLLRLSPQGQEAFATINARSDNEIGEMLGKLTPSEQQRLVAAMQTIESILALNHSNKAPYLLRPHQPGDMGWVIHRHGVLYAEEYGWDETFEVLVADVAARFIQNFDPKRERCWIAEVDGEIVGSVFVVKVSDEVAKLRLLYVEPKTRGMGIGVRLVEECIRFSKRTGYKKLILWTNNVLLAARHIYVKMGFKLVLEEPYHGFGHDLVGETWELEL